MLRPLACLTLLALAGAACSKRAPAKQEAAKEAPSDQGASAEVPLPKVTDEAESLLFSFLDAYGRVQAVSKVSEVPEARRSRVLVVDLSRPAEERMAHAYAFFADLTEKRADGTYPVTVVSRFDAAKGVDGPALYPAPEGSVIVYSAKWCRFCDKAKAWLSERGVPFVERDVEKQPGAANELRQKLKAAGIQGGGVPVIDWGGTLIMGFDAAKMARLFEEKPPGQEG